MPWRLQRLGSIALGAALSLALGGAAGAGQRPDAWVTTKVKMSLLTRDGISAAGVLVDTTDGRVTLHGAVPTEADKSRAEQAAKRVEGVAHVRNLLRVVEPRRARRMAASNEQVEQRVKAALKADPALADSSIQVESVKAGVVLLGGGARTLSAAYRAIDIAISVPGVHRVASAVESPDTLGSEELWRDGTYDASAGERSAARDTWITAAAKMRLTAHRDTPGFDLNVDTKNGVVTLFGVATSDQSRQAAESEVRKVDGVRNVVNDLQVFSAAKDHVDQEGGPVGKAIQTRFGANRGLEGAETSR